jgi:hypothetical protein
MILAPSDIAEYEEQIASFFRRTKSKAEGEAALSVHGALLLGALPDLLSTIRDSPAYAGVAFYGRFKAVDLKLIKKLALAKTAGAPALSQIRAAKALQVSAAAKRGWDFLLGTDVDALWNAIQLNLCRPTVVKAEKVPHPDANSDGDDYFDDHRDSDSDGDDDEEKECDEEDNDDNR